MIFQKKNNNRVVVDDVLLVHDVNNKVVEYTLRAAVEQIGNEEGGHYMTHLVNKGKVVTIDDKLFKGSYISEGSLADLELCQLFFFTKVPEEPELPSSFSHVQSDQDDDTNPDAEDDNEDEQGASRSPRLTRSTQSRQNISTPPRFKATPSPEKK